MQNVFFKCHLLVNRLLLLFWFVLLVARASEEPLSQWAKRYKRASQIHRSMEMDGASEPDQFSSLCETNKKCLLFSLFDLWKTERLIALFLANRWNFKWSRPILKANVRSAQLRRAQLQRTELAWKLGRLSDLCCVWSTDQDKQASRGPWISLIVMNDQLGKYYLHYCIGWICSIDVWTPHTVYCEIISRVIPTGRGLPFPTAKSQLGG